LPLGLNGSVDCDRFIERQGCLKADFPEIRIMRSIPIPIAGDEAMGRAVLRLAHALEAFSDYFLTDTLIVKGPATNAGDQPVEGFIGITGMTCDWDIARQLAQSVTCPIILAGGLDPDNVAGGIRRVNPAGVDSCTGTNARDVQGRPIRFKKDMDRLRRFIEETRRAENGPD
jgi:phosphoribosylanthranilate isomerase